MDSVKSTVTVLEEGNFTEEEGGSFDWRGYFSVGGYHFSVEEECVLISRRGSSLSGVGSHTLLGRGAIDLEEGSHTFTGQGVHFDLEEGVYYLPCIFVAMVLSWRIPIDA